LISRTRPAPAAWRRKTPQSGLSMIGFLFVVAVVLVVVFVGFRVFPAYIEYFSVQRAMVEALNATRDLNDTAEIRRHFQRRVDSGYIESVGGRDLEIKKVGNDFVATVAWTRKLPLVSNVSLLIEFDASATR
jgi:hypothetical protein